MSRALDISRAGMLLETPYPIESGRLSMMTVDMNNNLIEIKSELIYCSNSGPSTYHAGIKFISTDEQFIKFVTQMIKVYNHRKNNVLIAWSKNCLKESIAFG